MRRGVILFFIAAVLCSWCSLWTFHPSTTAPAAGTRLAEPGPAAWEPATALPPLLDTPITGLRAVPPGAQLDFEPSDAAVSLSVPESPTHAASNVERHASSNVERLIRMKALGRWGSASASPGLVSYRSQDANADIVYRPICNGVKEDLVLHDESSFGPGLFGWTLELAEGLNARLEGDGSISIRRDAILAAHLPAPVAHDGNGRLLTATFSLALPFIAVKVAPAAAFPVTVDPTVILDFDAELRYAGNDEGLVKFDTDQVHRDAVTGWKLDAWSSTATFTTGRRFHGSLIHNKRLYVFGGVTGPSSDLSDVRHALINDDGTVGAYAPTTSFPAPARGWFGSATYNGYLYIVGGSNFTSGSTESVVHYAKLNTDGTISSWQTGPALPTGRRRLGAVAVNGYLYAICGESSGGPQGDTYVAAIRADGSLGAWSSTSGPGFRMDHAVAATDGVLYLFGGTNASFNFNTVFFVRPNADGTLPAWNSTTANLTARNYATATAAGGYMFLAGGDGPLSSVEGAPILPGGGVGPWISTTALPGPRYGSRAATFNGRLFLTGGSDGTSDSNATFSALPQAGHAGPWTSTAFLTIPRSDIEAVAYNSFLYINGGYFGGSSTNLVQYAAVNADGTISNWTDTQPLPSPKYNHATVAHNGYLYNVGGNVGGGPVPTCHRAQISTSGPLVGGWINVNSLPQPRQQHAAVVANGRIYAIGGSNGGNQNTVFYTTINPDGSLSGWNTTSALLQPRTYHAAVAHGGYIYVIGGENGGVFLDTVEYAQINADGSLGPWAPNTSFTNGRAHASAAAIAGRMVLAGGGDSGGTIYDDVQIADINSDGTLASWQTTTSLPTSRRQAGTAVHNGCLYLIGGWPAPTPEVHFSRFTTHGTIGSWTMQSGLMPGPRSQCGMAAHNGYLYLCGGELGGGDNNDVLYAPLNLDGTVGTFTSTSSFPTARRGPGTVAHNGFLYVAGGYSAALGDTVTSIYYASINANGTVNTWNPATSLPAGAHNFGFSVYNGRLYAVGLGAGWTTVYVALINADGTLGSWTPTTSLPSPRNTFRSIAHSGYLYAIGGDTGAGLATTTHVAPINGDGTLGAWTTTTGLRSPRWYFACAAHAGWIYVIGGSTPGPSTTSVVAAPILSGGVLGDWLDVTNLPFNRQNMPAVVHAGVLYVQSGYSPPSHFNEIFHTRLRTPAPRATYSKLIDLGSDQNVTAVTTALSGSTGIATIQIRSSTTAAPAFGAATSGEIASGTPFPYVATARYLHLRYTLDDSNNVLINPDFTQHLAIDDIAISTTSPPFAPSSLEQRQDDDFVLIPLGGGADSTTVFVHADIDDPDGDDIRLHVEMKPVGTAFTNTPSASSSFTTSPNSLSLQITGLVAGTQYHWQAWVEDLGGAIGPKLSFGGNPESGVDFFVDQSPTAPTSINQFESDGVTPIPNGGTTLSSTVVLKGTRADPDALSLVTVELEIQPTATPFSDVATNTSTALAPGVEASFTLSGLSAGGYHWQMRGVDDNGKFSAWTPFSGSATHFTVVSNQPPDAPTLMLQFETDGTTPIVFGAAATAAAVKFQALLLDPNLPDFVRLQVELRPTGIAFTSPGTPAIDGIVFFETLLLAQGVQQIAVTIPADGTYHWQARAVDNSGAASAWTSAGGNNDPDDTDLSLDLVNDPPVVTSPGQFQSDGTTSIAIGGNGTPLGVVFKATVTDPEAATVTLEIELRDTVTGLSATATHTVGPIASGSTISVPATPALGAYHWAYRSTDGVMFSAWTSFGGNTENPPTNPAATDFDITANAGPTVAALAQFEADGTTPLATGAVAAGTSVVLQATVTDPEGQTVLLRVEVKPVGIAFDGATNLTDSALFPSGSTIQVTVPGLADDSYHWQAIGVDVQATPGSGLSFGGNPEADPDFRIDSTNGAPASPFGLGQYSPPGSVGLALGGAPFGRTVVIKATSSDDELGQIAFEIELQPIGTTFTGTRTHPAQLSFGPAGVSHTLTIDNLTAGSYHWQIRAGDAQGQFSAWVSYGGNSESAADFAITATSAVPPNSPLNLKQRLVNDLVDIAPGDTIAQAAIRLKALVVHPRTEIVKLQVEVKPISVPFTGEVTRESDLVDSGSVAEVVVYGMPNDSYTWQARTVDSKGTPSAWKPYGGAPDFVVSVPVNNAPDDPALILQLQANGTTQLAVGATTTQSSVTYGSIALDADGDPVRLELELKPTGVAFDGSLSGTTAFYPSGTTLYLQVGSLPDGRYHARLRMTDANGASSAWVAFGGNLEDDADFIVNATANAAPAIAAVLQQLREGGSVAIALGALAGADDITFRSDASDADATDLVRLEVEVRSTGEPLVSVATHSGDFVPQGYVTDTVVGRFVFGTSHHWQARVVDVNGATSGWLEYGGNPAGEADFTPSNALADSGSKKKCGLVGLEVLVLLLAWRRRRR